MAHLTYLTLDRPQFYLDEFRKELGSRKKSTLKFLNVDVELLIIGSLWFFVYAGTIFPIYIILYNLYLRSRRRGRAAPRSGCIKVQRRQGSSDYPR